MASHAKDGEIFTTIAGASFAVGVIWCCIIGEIWPIIPVLLGIGVGYVIYENIRKH